MKLGQSARVAGAAASFSASGRRARLADDRSTVSPRAMLRSGELRRAHPENGAHYDARPCRPLPVRRRPHSV